MKETVKDIPKEAITQKRKTAKREREREETNKVKQTKHSIGCTRFTRGIRLAKEFLWVVHAIYTGKHDSPNGQSNISLGSGNSWASFI